ncbi:MAG: ECF transporter S component [Conexivisphaerales archaeon]
MNEQELRRRSPAFYVANVAICAALYAVVNGLSALVPVPLVIGEFRPGVVIPALYTIAFGARVGAVGAAFGSLIGDILFLTPLGKTNPFLALVAGFPANLIGFLIFGYLVNKAKSWSGYTYSTLISLFVGNLIAGAVVVFVAIPGLTFSQQIAQTLLFTFFWLGTMIPFMQILLPILLSALQASSISSILNNTISTWKKETPRSIFMTGLLSSLPLLVILLASYQSSFEGLLGPYATWFRILVVLSAAFLLAAPVAPYLSGRKQ